MNNLLLITLIIILYFIFDGRIKKLEYMVSQNQIRMFEIIAMINKKEIK
jgi:hypothetical protein